MLLQSYKRDWLYQVFLYVSKRAYMLMRCSRLPGLSECYSAKNTPMKHLSEANLPIPSFNSSLKNEPFLKQRTKSRRKRHVPIFIPSFQLYRWPFFCTAPACFSAKAWVTDSAAVQLHIEFARVESQSFRRILWQRKKAKGTLRSCCFCLFLQSPCQYLFAHLKVSINFQHWVRIFKAMTSLLKVSHFRRSCGEWDVLL